MASKSNFKFSCLILLLGTVGGCASPAIKEPFLPIEAYKSADDFLTVDCLLPGQPIQLGMHHVWMSPPRPAIISALECKLQGGQYALPSDKDGREKVLGFWQESANQGDKEAQNYMGEIYATSWGEIKPDYAQAAKWYRKSAGQGFTRAQNNLGFLYEHGLGVPQDKQIALNFYRQAMGEIKPIVLEQNVKNEIDALKSKLEQANQKIEKLEKQLRESRGTIQRSAVQNRISDAQQQRDTVRDEIAKIETQAAFEQIPDMGKYYALIIGINNYRSPLTNLTTPVNDAKRVEEVLRKKYGFETVLLVDDGRTTPTRFAINRALRELRQKIKRDDNLLIYYAGHGEFYLRRGHWLAQDAKKDDVTNWLSTDDLTKQIQYLTAEPTSLKARHVLVVADSCYGAALAMSWLEPPRKQIVVSLPHGLATRSAYPTHVGMSQNEPALSPLLLDGESAEDRIAIKKALYASPSRKLLSSGGLAPVIDEAFKNGLSVFANAFTEVLEVNEGIITAREIHFKILPRVFTQVKKRTGMEQKPDYRPIQNAGDNSGEFLFIPRKN